MEKNMIGISKNAMATGRSVVCALALAGLAASAQAADMDLGSMKDPLPDTLSWHGITVYGTIDVGYAYQSNGVPLNASIPDGLEYQALTTTRNFYGKPVSTVASSGLELSRVGIKIEENVGYGFTAIGRLETRFNPLSGELMDGCKSILVNSGVPFGHQTSNGDSSICGQAFNAVAFAGVSNSAYGTLTIGRQNDLQLDALAVYDPQLNAPAFSIFGYSGSDGGAGSTQAARWDNSIKYLFQYGPAHVGAMFSSGGQDTGILGTSYGANVGVAYKGFSVDAVYEKEHGAVNLRSAFDNVPGGPLNAFISDNESWNIMGKYTFELGGCCGYKDGGGLKDAVVEGAKLTLYAGYSHIEKAPTATGFGSTFDQSQGGYPIDVAIDLNSSQVFQYEWVGARYQLPTGWSFTGAYYHISQNSFTINAFGGPSNLGCAAAGLLCSGDFNEVSFVVDYAFNKHFDVYAGLNWSQVTNGLASGFAGTPAANATFGSEEQTTFMTGMRLKF